MIRNRFKNYSRQLLLTASLFCTANLSYADEVQLAEEYQHYKYVITQSDKGFGLEEEKSNTTLLEPEYGLIEALRGEYVYKTCKQNKCGAIRVFADMEGVKYRQLIEPLYDDIKTKGGVYVVVKDGMKGMADDKGQLKLKPGTYKNFRPLSSETTLVLNDDESSFLIGPPELEKWNETVVEYKKANIRFLIAKNKLGKYGVINFSSGREEIPFNYDQIIYPRRMDSDYVFEVRKKDKSGIFDLMVNQETVPTIYHEVEYIASCLVFITTDDNGESSIITRRGKKIVDGLKGKVRVMVRGCREYSVDGIKYPLFED